MAISVFSQSSIFGMEYYLDSDPGVGNGTAISITPGVNQDVDISINTSGLSVGFHELVVRARYSDGTWGIHESQVFYVSQSSASTIITEMEYFFDTDPGFGNGTSFTVSPGETIDMQALFTTTSLSTGFHILHVRAKDNDGVWGMHQSQVFYIDNLVATGSNGNLSGIEYFIDSDPGIGSGSEIAIDPAVSSIDDDYTLETSDLPHGNYTLGVRVFNGNGSYSITEMANFDICTGATVDFSANTVCVGTATDFTDLSTDTEAGDIYSWDFDNDGSEDDNTAGNTSFTYLSAGSYTAVLTIDKAGCAVSKEISVTVESNPSANAGADQNVTSDNTTLAATAPASGETGTWSIISGTGSFANANDPNTTLSGISEGQTEVRWTVVNDLAGCTSFDDLIITRSAPALSDETDILTFSLQEQFSPATIDDVNHTISMLVELGTDLSILNPSITISSGASISPSGPQDFTNTVIYTVTAEDGITTQEWTTNIEERPLGLTGADIQVYPNPTNDKVFIQNISQPYEVKLLDTVGKEYYSGKNSQEVSLGKLSEGVYLMTIKPDESNAITLRIVKNN